jgi:hypothetical protein
MTAAEAAARVREIRGGMIAAGMSPVQSLRMAAAAIRAANAVSE